MINVLNRLTPFPSTLLLLTLAAAGCASGSFSDYQVWPATDLPDRFVQAATGLEPTASDAGECRSPLIDPRTGVNLLMVRSIPGVGDYEVPAGAYGTGQRELLRIDCERGVGVGIVRR